MPQEGLGLPSSLRRGPGQSRDGTQAGTVQGRHTPKRSPPGSLCHPSSAPPPSVAYLGSQDEEPTFQEKQMANHSPFRREA